MYQNILLPIDGSQYSLRAVDNALELVKDQPDAHITLLNVLPPAYFLAEAGLAAAMVNLDLNEEAQNRADDLLNHVGEKLQTAHVSFETHLEKGVPAQVICQYAEDQDYDLIVMGSRGLGAFSEFVLGSVSHKVLSHVHTPVLVIR